MRSIGPMELLVLAFAVVIVVTVIRSLKSGSIVGFALLGAVLGAVLGFLLRPSVPLVGQLPLEIVLSRGAGLNGMDVLLRSTAEQSFNYLLIGTILGGVIAGGAKSMGSQKSLPTTTATPSPSPTTPPATADSTVAAKAFCTKCGTPLVPDVVFCGSCGTRRG